MYLSSVSFCFGGCFLGGKGSIVQAVGLDWDDDDRFLERTDFEMKPGMQRQWLHIIYHVTRKDDIQLHECTVLLPDINFDCAPHVKPCTFRLLCPSGTHDGRAHDREYDGDDNERKNASKNGFSPPFHLHPP